MSSDIDYSAIKDNNDKLHVVNYFETFSKKIEKSIEDFKNNSIRNNNVNINANEKASEPTHHLEHKANSELKKFKMYKFWKIFMIVLSILLIGGTVASFIYLMQQMAYIPIILLVLAIASIFLIFYLHIQKKQIFKKMSSTLEELKKAWATAFKTAAPFISNLDLNFEYDFWNQAYESLIFSPMNATDFKVWKANASIVTGNLHNTNESVTKIFHFKMKNNPGMYLETLKMEMVPHVYTGAIPVTWTMMQPVTTTGPNGRTSTSMRPVTMHGMCVAKATHPVPQYTKPHYIYYLNKAAPELMFSFGQMPEFQSLFKDIKSNKTKKYEMDNPAFNKKFSTIRNDEEKYRLLFSPLAQEEIVNLITHGDKFSFFKYKELNILTSDVPPHTFTNLNNDITYDIKQTQENILAHLQTFIKSLYWSLAPILAIPLYQQYSGSYYKKGEKIDDELAPPEVESIINNNYSIDNVDTKTTAKIAIIDINKVDSYTSTSSSLKIKWTAHSFKTRPRVDMVPSVGPDMRPHIVPVHWIEYIPISNSSTTTHQLEKNFNTTLVKESYQQKFISRFPVK